MSKIQAKARVQLTIEVDVGAPWGEDCTIGQVYKQAAEAAHADIIHILKLSGQGRILMLGEPKVVGIITEKE